MQLSELSLQALQGGPAVCVLWKQHCGERRRIRGIPLRQARLRCIRMHPPRLLPYMKHRQARKEGKRQTPPFRETRFRYRWQKRKHRAFLQVL